GKTKTLTERTGRLIRGGANPASILCLTFTNKARDEMRSRIVAVHGPLAEKVFISNFHGLCGILLRHMGSPLGYNERMTICDSDDQADLLQQIARMKGLELTKPQGRVLSYVVNDWRENLGTPEQFDALADHRIKPAELGVLRKYLQQLRQRNMCDFSGLLSETARLLQECPEVRQRLQKRFRFIQVDEYQDTNRAQNQIVELLAGEEDNVLAVGDGDQSIYEWRGASPDAIQQFIRNGEAKTGQCKVVKLGVNYRSTPQVIEVADRLIRHCAHRIPVEFTTINRPGEPAKCGRFSKPEEEAEAIAGGIHNLIRTGTSPREIAIFYRTNDMSRLVEQSLAKRQIPYEVVGSGSYYDRMEVRDVLSMLRFLCNPKDGISFARIANKPARGMGDVLIGKLETYAEKRGIDLLTALRDEHLLQLRDEQGKPLTDTAFRACHAAHEIFGIPTLRRSVYSIANEVLDRSHYDEWLRDKYEDDDEYESRRRNVNELIHSIGEFSRTSPHASIADYLQSISLYTDTDAARDGNAVRMMSLHASKGLEFDVVYIIGLEQGILPHAKAVEERGPRGLDEERRLCYVGFTRARKVLRVTWCQQRQDTSTRGPRLRLKASLPSQFLLESGLISSAEYQSALSDARTTRRPSSTKVHSTHC
ncbi:MAG: ATP-dependent helicase, partial [Bacillota bacterium]